MANANTTKSTTMMKTKTMSSKVTYTLSGGNFGGQVVEVDSNVTVIEMTDPSDNSVHLYDTKVSEGKHEANFIGIKPVN